MSRGELLRLANETTSISPISQVPTPFDPFGKFKFACRLRCTTFHEDTDILVDVYEVQIENSRGVDRDHVAFAAILQRRGERPGVDARCFCCERSTIAAEQRSLTSKLTQAPLKWLSRLAIEGARSRLSANSRYSDGNAAIY
jgi:hypothetical protein